jgi:ABC-2 type transport system permease protein
MNVNVLVALVVLIPSIVFFVGFGLLAGSLFNDKQVGGICGALLTNVSAWLSGTFFDLKLVGGAFAKVAYLLPFAHAVDATKAAIAGDYGSIMPHLWWVIGYAVVVMGIAVVVFRRTMTSDNA